METILILMIVFLPLQEVERGKSVFLESNCQKCHSVDSQGIATTSKKDLSEVSDLSNAGNDLTKDEMWAFLRKESERNGELHKYKFRGEKADFEALIAWLQSLKTTSGE